LVPVESTSIDFRRAAPPDAAPGMVIAFNFFEKLRVQDGEAQSAAGTLCRRPGDKKIAYQH